MKFTILVDPSYVIITTHLICLIDAWEYIRNNAFSLHDLFGHAQAHESLPWGHKNYNFGGPFLGHHYYALSLSDLCLGAEKMIFKEIMYFHYITHMATP